MPDDIQNNDTSLGMPDDLLDQLSNIQRGIPEATPVEPEKKPESTEPEKKPESVEKTPETEKKPESTEPEKKPGEEVSEEDSIAKEIEEKYDDDKKVPMTKKAGAQWGNIRTELKDTKLKAYTLEKENAQLKEQLKESGDESVKELKQMLNASFAEQSEEYKEKVTKPIAEAETQLKTLFEGRGLELNMDEVYKALNKGTLEEREEAFAELCEEMDLPTSVVARAARMFTTLDALWESGTALKQEIKASAKEILLAQWGISTEAREGKPVVLNFDSLKESQLTEILGRVVDTQEAESLIGKLKELPEEKILSSLVELEKYKDIEKKMEAVTKERDQALSEVKRYKTALPGGGGGNSQRKEEKKKEEGFDLNRPLKDLTADNLDKIYG